MSKILKFCFVFTIVLSFASCSDDDSSSSSSNADLVGTWALVSFQTSSTTTVEAQGQTINSMIDVASTDNVDYTITFTENAFTTQGGYEYTFSGSSNGVTIPATTTSVDNVMGSGTYSVSGNTMTIDGSFFEFDFQGMDLMTDADSQTSQFQISGNQLTFTQDGQVVESTTNGVTSTSQSTGSSVFVRI